MRRPKRSQVSIPVEILTVHEPWNCLRICYCLPPTDVVGHITRVRQWQYIHPNCPEEHNALRLRYKQTGK